VLPHGRKSELDVIVFLPDELQPESEDEAKELGALAALQRIAGAVLHCGALDAALGRRLLLLHACNATSACKACACTMCRMRHVLAHIWPPAVVNEHSCVRAGHRALDRILPKQYVPVWNRLGEIAAERAERAAAAAVRDAKHKAREQARNQRELKELLTSTAVTMTTEKVDLVQQLIAHLTVSRGAPNGNSGRGGPGGQGGGELAAPVRRKLEGMGISREHVELAGAHVATGAGADEALDWLCMHVAAAELPPALRGRHRGGVTLVRAAAAAGGHADGAFSAADDPAVQALARWGYSVVDAAAALETAGGDIGAAWALLFDRLVGSEGAPVAAPGAAALADAERGADGAASTGPLGDESGAAVAEAAEEGNAWADELTVLQSMYSADVMLATARCAALRAPLPAQLYAHHNPHPPPGAVVPDMRLVVVHTPSSGYPEAALPLFGVACRALPGPIRLDLVARAARHLRAGCVGGPVLVELYEWLRCALDVRPPALLSAARVRFGALMAAPTASLAAYSERTAAPEESGAAAQRRRAPRQRGGAARSEQAMAAESAQLRGLLERNRTAAGAAAEMRRARAALPAANQRTDVLRAIESHRAVVVAGATGCGKSTQVRFPVCSVCK
jgi:hypothetical protein